LSQEELAGPIKEDGFRLGIIASRPQKIAQVLETKVSLEGDDEPFFADYRLGPAGHFLPISGLGGPREPAMTLIKQSTGAIK